MYDKHRNTKQYKNGDIQSKFNDMVQTLDVLDELLNDIESLHEFKKRHNLRSTQPDIVDVILECFERTLAENEALKKELSEIKKSDGVIPLNGHGESVTGFITGKLTLISCSTGTGKTQFIDTVTEHLTKGITDVEESSDLEGEE